LTAQAKTKAVNKYFVQTSVWPPYPTFRSRLWYRNQ